MLNNCIFRGCRLHKRTRNLKVNYPVITYHEYSPLCFMLQFSFCLK